jgi:carbamoyltransferase
MKKVYIGLATTPHDPALSILDSNGKVLFAEGSERHLQNKRSWNSPPDDFIRIRSLLKEYADDAEQIVVCSSWSRQSAVNLRSIVHGRIKGRIFKWFVARWQAAELYHTARMYACYRQADPGTGIALQNYYLRPERPVEYRSFNHHLTHAATGCYSSGYDEAVCAVVDGWGENTANAFYRYQNGKLTHLSQFPNSNASLGMFYVNLCTWCGFDYIQGEEWKVMGLAPYGRKDEEIYGIMRDYTQIKNGRVVPGKFRKTAEQKLKALTRPETSPPIAAANMAYTGQLFFSELFTELLNHPDLQCSSNLVIGGGCGLNSVFNGTVNEQTKFKNVFVFSAPADDGNALGAAWLGFFQDHPDARVPKTIQSPYLGSTVGGKSLRHLEKYGQLNCKHHNDHAALCDEVAGHLQAGKVVGWIQGRAEFGPRALGNRSILADPRSADIKERLNDQVKFREEFRPFAPSILHEYGEEYFDNYQPTPYMERALRFKPAVKAKVPAVVHVDGTGRLQSVKREWNPQYYDLIDAFRKKTGIPILLNTSFNVMGKPIVHSVEDAVAVLMTSGLDVLVINNQVFWKGAARQPQTALLAAQLQTELS